MTDIEKVRMLTGNQDISEEFVSFLLSTTEDLVKAYCNIQAIPPQLHNIVIEMTALRVKANANGAVSALGEGLKLVQSLSDGNQSVGFATSASGARTFASDEDIVAAYAHILDKYKRMVVDKPYGCCDIRMRGRPRK